MTDFIYVPRGSDTQAVGGFILDEVAGYKYTPLGNKLTSGSDPSKESRLVVVLKPTGENKEVLYFFGKVADNLLCQIEDRILQSKETSLED
jgi:hypothetical protein